MTKRHQIKSEREYARWLKKNWFEETMRILSTTPSEFLWFSETTKSLPPEKICSVTFSHDEGWTMGTWVRDMFNEIFVAESKHPEQLIKPEDNLVVINLDTRKWHVLKVAISDNPFFDKTRMH